METASKGQEQNRNARFCSIVGFSTAVVGFVGFCVAVLLLTLGKSLWWTIFWTALILLPFSFLFAPAWVRYHIKVQSLKGMLVDWTRRLYFETVLESWIWFGIAAFMLYHAIPMFFWIIVVVVGWFYSVVK